MVSLLGSALGMIVAPIWVPFVHGGAHLGFWHIHTFLQSLVLVPVGLVLLPVTLALARPLGGRLQADRRRLLREPARHRGPARRPRMRRVSARAGLAFAGPIASRAVSPRGRRRRRVLAVLVVIWAATSRSYFWPIWVALPFAAALGIHAWLYELGRAAELVRDFRGSAALAGTAGVACDLLAVHSRDLGDHQPRLLLADLDAARRRDRRRGSRRGGAARLAARAEMAERIETLDQLRAPARSNVQESELRRIERDLHDGAQARLVALGMSLGMAEQKLAEDPERAGELLAEARAGAEEALRELRDLARGIHPPVLTDRGLEAAVTALANATPMHVALSVDVPAAAAVGGRERRLLRRRRGAGQCRQARAAPSGWTSASRGRSAPVELEIKDDGIGGAESERQRARRAAPPRRGAGRHAQVTSPEGGPTTDLRRAAVRVVIAEDLALLRDGLTRLLRDNEIEVVAAVSRRRGARP